MNADYQRASISPDWTESTSPIERFFGTREKVELIIRLNKDNDQEVDISVRVLAQNVFERIYSYFSGQQACHIYLDSSPVQMQNQENLNTIIKDVELPSVKEVKENITGTLENIKNKLSEKIKNVAQQRFATDAQLHTMELPSNSADKKNAGLDQAISAREKERENLQSEYQDVIQNGDFEDFNKGLNNLKILKDKPTITEETKLTPIINAIDTAKQLLAEKLKERQTNLTDAQNENGDTNVQTDKIDQDIEKRQEEKKETNQTFGKVIEEEDFNDIDRNRKEIADQKNKTPEPTQYEYGLKEDLPITELEQFPNEKAFQPYRAEIEPLNEEISPKQELQITPSEFSEPSVQHTAPSLSSDSKLQNEEINTHSPMYTVENEDDISEPSSQSMVTLKSNFEKIFSEKNGSVNIDDATWNFLKNSIEKKPELRNLIGKTIIRFNEAKTLEEKTQIAKAVFDELYKYKQTIMPREEDQNVNDNNSQTLPKIEEIFDEEFSGTSTLKSEVKPQTQPFVTPAQPNLSFFSTPRSQEEVPTKISPQIISNEQTENLAPEMSKASLPQSDRDNDVTKEEKLTQTADIQSDKETDIGTEPQPAHLSMPQQAEAPTPYKAEEKKAEVKEEVKNRSDSAFNTAKETLAKQVQDRFGEEIKNATMYGEKFEKIVNRFSKASTEKDLTEANKAYAKLTQEFNKNQKIVLPIREESATETLAETITNTEAKAPLVDISKQKEALETRLKNLPTMSNTSQLLTRLSEATTEREVETIQNEMIEISKSFSLQKRQERAKAMDAARQNQQTASHRESRSAIEEPLGQTHSEKQSVQEAVLQQPAGLDESAMGQLSTQPVEDETAIAFENISDQELELDSVLAEIETSVENTVKKFDEKSKQLTAFGGLKNSPFDGLKKVLEERKKALEQLTKEGTTWSGFFIDTKTSLEKMNPSQIKAHLTMTKNQIKKEEDFLLKLEEGLKKTANALTQFEMQKAAIKAQQETLQKETPPQHAESHKLSELINSLEKEISSHIPFVNSEDKLAIFTKTVYESSEKLGDEIKKSLQKRQQLTLMQQLSKVPENSESAKNIKDAYIAEVQNKVKEFLEKTEAAKISLGKDIGDYQHYFSGNFIDGALNDSESLKDLLKDSGAISNRAQLLAFDNKVSKALKKASDRLTLLTTYHTRIETSIKSFRSHIESCEKIKDELKKNTTSGALDSGALDIDRLQNITILDKKINEAISTITSSKALTSFADVEALLKTVGREIGKLSSPLPVLRNQMENSPSLLEQLETAESKPSVYSSSVIKGLNAAYQEQVQKKITLAVNVVQDDINSLDQEPLSKELPDDIKNAIKNELESKLANIKQLATIFTSGNQTKSVNDLDAKELRLWTDEVENQDDEIRTTIYLEDLKESFEDLNALIAVSTQNISLTRQSSQLLTARELEHSIQEVKERKQTFLKEFSQELQKLGNNTSPQILHERIGDYIEVINKCVKDLKAEEDRKEDLNFEDQLQALPSDSEDFKNLRKQLLDSVSQNITQELKTLEGEIALLDGDFEKYGVKLGDELKKQMLDNIEKKQKTLGSFLLAPSTKKSLETLTASEFTDYRKEVEKTIDEVHIGLLEYDVKKRMTIYDEAKVKLENESTDYINSERFDLAARLDNLRLKGTGLQTNISKEKILNDAAELDQFLRNIKNVGQLWNEGINQVSEDAKQPKDLLKQIQVLDNNDAENSKFLSLAITAFVTKQIEQLDSKINELRTIDLESLKGSGRIEEMIQELNTLKNSYTVSRLFSSKNINVREINHARECADYKNAINKKLDSLRKELQTMLKKA